MDAGRRRRWVFHLLAERSNRVVVRAPVNVTVHVRRFHRITLSQKRRKFPQQDRIASAACSVAVFELNRLVFPEDQLWPLNPASISSKRGLTV